MALPLPALPAIPARYVVTTQDRFIPPEVQRRVAAERLGITEVDEVDAGPARGRRVRPMLVVETGQTGLIEHVFEAFVGHVNSIA